MAPYGSQRGDWNNYREANEPAEFEPSFDAQSVERIAATLRDRSQSYEETMESVARIAKEWRVHSTTPRELERLAWLVFSTIEPDASWADSADEVKKLYRERAEALLEGGYRKVDN